MRSRIDIIDLDDFDLPKPSEFPNLIDFHGTGIARFDRVRPREPYIALLGGSEKDQIVKEEVKFYRGELSASQITTLFGLHAFKVSHNLSTGPSGYDMKRLFRLGNTLKHVAQTSSSWKRILTAGAGAMWRPLIEKLFEFSIISRDRTLAELMLQLGADAYQQIFDWRLGMRVSALNYSIGPISNPITNLLLESGAVYGQISFKHAIMAEDLCTADRILKFNQSLDVDFNYLDSIDQRTSSFLGQLKLEKATLLGLVCLGVCNWSCYCDASTLSSSGSHSPDCLRYTSITSLEFLIRRGATIDLDTMIMASFNADVVTLRFLMQHGGKVDGLNLFGFSCLDAASLRDKLQYGISSILLSSGATINIPRAHHAFGSRASPLHHLILSHRRECEYIDRSLHDTVNLLIDSGADINYIVRQPGSPSELALAHEKFLWTQSMQHVAPNDLIAQSKAETPLEYAIVVGCESIALALANRDSQLTGREIMLAVKMGSNSLLNVLIERDRSNFDKESTRRTCLRLALRWGHETIVRYLLGKGIDFSEDNIIDALQYPGTSALSTKTQSELIRATPGIDELQISGLSLLELCALKFTADAMRDILARFPAAYDSGALAAIVMRSLNCFRGSGEYDFRLIEFQELVSRRTESNCDWEKENTALLFAAMFDCLDVLRILVTPGTTCRLKKARITREDFSSFLYPQYSAFFSKMDFKHYMECQDWVSCSPLMGIAMAPDDCSDWSISGDMLDHLLSCSYEPDALTVVMAAARGKRLFLRRLQYLDNCRSILSIDNDSRPPWCPTALQAAASTDNEEMVEFLLESGANVNEAPAAERIGYHLPRTALQAAVNAGNMRLTNRLIERGACINAPAAEDSGATALQLALFNGFITISLRLLELGADVNARGAQRHGRTALEGAAEHGRIDTIQLLLNHGACTDGIYREQYLKAILYAERNRQFAAAAFLKEHREWNAEDEECYKSLQSGGWYETSKDPSREIVML